MGTDRYFTQRFLGPIFDKQIDVLTQRLKNLNASDLQEVLAFYFENNSMQGIEAVVDALPCGDYADEIVRLSTSETPRGLKAFDRLLEKNSSDKSRLYERCIFSDGHAHCIAVLRSHYTPNETRKNTELWQWLLVNNRMECWEDIVMLSSHLPDGRDQEHLNYMIEEMVTQRCDHLTDEEKGKALRAFIAERQPNTSYNFPAILIREYARSYDPVVFEIIQEFPQTTDIHNVYNAPLRWAVTEKCYTVFEYFYDLSAGEQRTRIYEQLDMRAQKTWDEWESFIVRKRLEDALAGGCERPKRKI